MKKIFSLVALLAMAASVTLSCKKEESSPVIGVKENTAPAEVQGIKITSKANSIVIGQTLKLEVTVLPETAAVGVVTWSSADEKVATVTSDGTVTGVAVGIVRVSATMSGKTSSAIINVVGERVAASEIILSRTEKATVTGRSFTLTATLAPDNTTDQRNFTWTSSNEKVAVVNSGYVTAMGEGEADIIVAQGELTASCKVSVGALKLNDMAGSWKISNTAVWNKNWSGVITGWSATAKLETCDAANHYFGVIEAKESSVEALVNELVNEVEGKKETSGNPSSVLSKTVPETKTVNTEGEYIAYVLGYDEEYEFEGDYLIYRFTASEPDPTHATGIKFTQGYNGTEITSISLSEGKTLQYFKASLLPADCTDTGDITLTSTDTDVVTIAPYYSGYYTVTAEGMGTAAIKASFKYKDLPEITAEIPVTITAGLTLTDCSSSWTYTYGTGDEVFVQLNTCTDPGSAIVAMDSSTWRQYVSYGYYPDPDKPAAVANWVQDDLTSSWSSTATSTTLPHKVDVSYYGSTPANLTFYAFGLDASGALTGKYAHWEIDRSVEPGGGDGGDGGDGGSTDPDPEEPSTGSIMSIDGQYFPLDWSDSDAVQDEVTMEAWFNSSSFSGGKDNIYTIMGTEGIFLLRFEGAQLNLVYGGTKNTNNNEYAEKKITYGTNISTGEWHHVAATYKNGGDVILYLDGNSVGTGTAEAHGIELNGIGANWVLPFKFYVGVSSNTRVWKGSLAEVRVWNKVRTASEIKDSMNKSLSSGTGLMASWPINEGSGNSLADASGNGNNLTATGGNVTWTTAARPF